MDNINQYGRKPGENINDPLIILPPPPRPPYPPYPGSYLPPCPLCPPVWGVPTGRPCYGPRCRRRRVRDPYDYDRRPHGPWY